MSAAAFEIRSEASSLENKKFLKPGETDFPQAVAQVAALLDRLDVSYRLSRNPPVLDCPSAARQRWRLGRRGVRLWHELKSFVGCFQDPHGSECIFVAHYRADRELDLGKLQQLVKARSLPRRLEAEELSELGLAYGLVNPFAPPFQDQHRIVTVFDFDVVKPLDAFKTVFTNAGSLTWAVEFDVVAYVQWATERGALLADISTSNPARESRRVFRPCRLGIISGSYGEADALFLGDLQSRLRSYLATQAGEELMLPRIFHQVCPEFALALELDQYPGEIEEVLRATVQSLFTHGVDALAIPCVSTQHFQSWIQEACDSSGVKLLTAAEAVTKELARLEISEVTWLGNPYVSNHEKRGPWSEAFRGVELRRPKGSDLERFRNLLGLMRAESISPQSLNRFHDLLLRLPTQHIVLGMPELSLLARHQRRKGRGGKKIMDVLRLHALAVADNLRAHSGGMDDSEEKGDNK